MKDLSQLLICPRSGAALTERGRSFVSADGASSYPTEEGIIDLRCNRRDYYFNPVPRDAMSALTSAARQVPWPVTIRRFMSHVKHNPDWLDNLVADGRYAWKLLLDLDSRTEVLDLGCGLGNLTRNLAPHVGRVFAMDLTIERLRFAGERFARFNGNDRIVLLAAGDGRYLPFRDQSLDLVIVSGVLEWVADDGRYSKAGQPRISKAIRMSLSTFGESSPRAIQRRFLQEVRRVLKPTGQVFIAIENRLNLEYFYKRADHHSGLRFASLLPRFAANLYSIVAVRRPYRTYTYSLSGYRRLLKSAGLDSSQFFALSPGYSNLREIRPLVTDEDFWAPTQRNGLRQRILDNRNFVPAFGIIGKRSAVRHTSLLGRLIASIEPQLKPAAPLGVRDFRVTGHDQGVLQISAGTQEYLLQTPFNAFALATMKRQQQMLTRIGEHSPMRHLLPSIPLHGSFNGVDYFVERRPPGRALLESLASAGREAHLEEVVALLQTIARDDTRAAPTQFGSDWFEKEVEEPVQRIARALDSPGLISPLADFLRRGLLGVPLAAGLAHGNFTAASILVKDNAVSGLVDWGFSRAPGLPILDFLDYLHSVQAHCRPHGSEAENLELLADGAWPSRREWDFLVRLYGDFGADFARHRHLVYLGWVHRICRQLQGYMVYDAKAIDDRIVQVLKRFNAARAIATPRQGQFNALQAQR
jgi:SAM-dependent methyltransferase